MRSLLTRLWFALVFAPLPAFGNLGAPVPLTVTDRSGVARNNEGITTGVPIPQSANVSDVRNLMITAGAGHTCAGGKIIDSMLTVAARWGGEPGDGAKPIKWVWVEFIGSVGANSFATYCLADRTGPDPGTTAVTVIQDRTFITIATGAMTVKVRKDYFNFLDTVQVGNATVVGSAAGSKWTVTAGGVEYNSVNTDESYRATVEYPQPRPSVNAAGEAIRAQVKLTGRFTSHNGPQKLQYQFRLVTYANSTDITLYPTITFSEDCFAFRPTNIALSLQTQLNDSLTYTFGTGSGANTGSYTSSDDLLLTQFDHGNGVNGYAITKNGAVLEAGKQALGWLDINDGSKGVTAWVQDFWQNYPLGLEAKGKALSIQLWPTYDFTREFDAKRDNALKDVPGYGVIWPAAEGTAMDFTPQVPNASRIIRTATNASPPVISVAGFNVIDTGGVGFCHAELRRTSGCNYWPVGSPRRIYIQGFRDSNWSRINGYQNARYLGTADAQGFPQFALDGFDSNNWGTPSWGNPGHSGLCKFAGESSACPMAGSMDSLTDMNAVGVAKTWWIKLGFYAGRVVAGRSTAARFADRLMLTNPFWYAESQALGRIREVDAAGFPKAEAVIRQAFGAMRAKDVTNNNYGTFNWGDTQYEQTLTYSGEGARTWAFSRKNREFVPWLLYVRSGDPMYMNYGIANGLHGMDVDIPHSNVSFTDAKGNKIVKKSGSGPCTHGPTHWFPVYENYSGPNAYDCSEGEQPTLDYQSEALSAMYYVLAYDRAREILLDRANFVIATEAAAGNAVDHIGARNLGGCLQIGLDAYKTTGSLQYLRFAEKCFAAAVKHEDGLPVVGNPIGFVQGDRYGNGINWGYFGSSWLNLTFPEFAEIDPDFCAPDVNGVRHCVRGEFVRFARATAAMGSNNGTTGVYYYGYPCKTWAYAYQYTKDPTFLQYGRMLFTMFTASPEGNGVNGGVRAIVGPGPDPHDWSMYLQGLPYAMYALAGQNPSLPATPAFPLKIPSDGTVQTLLINKKADQAWTFSLSVDTGVDFGGDFFKLAGTVNVDVYDPTGALAQHNAIGACTYRGPAQCIPNSYFPVQSGNGEPGRGKSVTYGGVDNRVLTFSVPADGKTGEYQIRLSAVNHAQQLGGCIGEAKDRY